MCGGGGGSGAVWALILFAMFVVLGLECVWRTKEKKTQIKEINQLAQAISVMYYAPGFNYNSIHCRYGVPKGGAIYLPAIMQV